jgi:hypothetical protein
MDSNFFISLSLLTFRRLPHKVSRGFQQAVNMATVLMAFCNSLVTHQRLSGKPARISKFFTTALSNQFLNISGNEASTNVKLQAVLHRVPYNFILQNLTRKSISDKPVPLMGNDLADKSIISFFMRESYSL